MSVPPAAAIDSVLNQGHRIAKLVCSTDNSRAVIARNGARIRFALHDPADFRGSALFEKHHEPENLAWPTDGSGWRL